jgi:hypothetical protein
MKKIYISLIAYHWNGIWPVHLETDCIDKQASAIQIKVIDWRRDITNPDLESETEPPKKFAEHLTL